MVIWPPVCDRAGYGGLEALRTVHNDPSLSSACCSSDPEEGLLSSAWLCLVPGLLAEPALGSGMEAWA